MSVDQQDSIDWSPGSRTDPADCAPWCQERGEGHWPAGHPAECSTFGEEVTLSVGRPVLMEGVADTPSAVMGPDYAHVYLWRAPDEGVTVNISHHGDPGPVMTVPEARQLAALLLRLADTADQHHQAGR